MITTTNGNTNGKRAMNARLVSKSLAILFVLAFLPEFVSARYSTCGRYNNHWTNPMFERRRRLRNPVTELFNDWVEAGWNSLARQERVAIHKRRQPRYLVEDHGKDGLELRVEMKGLSAREIDLEISQSDNGDHVLTVHGSPNRYHRRSHLEVSQSFLLNHVYSIDIDGIHASFESEILTIHLPRRLQTPRKRKRFFPSVMEQEYEDSPLEGDTTLLYDARRGDFYGPKKRKKAKKRPTSKPVVADATSRKIVEDLIPKEDQSEDEYDDDLWISEEEDI